MITFIPSATQIKALSIPKPIWQFYFIFGMNVALHMAVTIRINNFETNQNGHHVGRFSPSALQMKTLIISEPIRRIYFICDTNVTLHRAINILIKNLKKNPKWPPSGHIYSLRPVTESIKYL